jgi:hypothetical protein
LLLYTLDVFVVEIGKRNHGADKQEHASLISMTVPSERTRPGRQTVLQILAGLGSSQATSASSYTITATGARVGPMQRRMSAFGQSDAAKDYIFTAYPKR